MDIGQTCLVLIFEKTLKEKKRGIQSFVTTYPTWKAEKVIVRRGAFLAKK